MSTVVHVDNAPTLTGNSDYENTVSVTGMRESFAKYNIKHNLS